MERKSSIHIEKATPGEFFHNDRTKPTANSIFSTKNNFCSLSGLDAINLYKKDIKEKTKIYTEKTGKKLHKNTITLLSAIVNLDKQHAKEDLEKICDYLEQSLETKIYQYAIHKDEGWIDEETGEKYINYHAHILFSGLDNEGRSVRKKLTRSYLIKLQDEVAKILNMQRGINYTKERKKRPKRLGTYEYKEYARRKEKEVKELKKELAKVKDLKEENKKLKALFKELGAKRDDYAYLENYVKKIKEFIKKKKLTKEELEKKMEEIKEKVKQRIAEKEKIILEQKKQLDFFNKKIEIFEGQFTIENKKNSLRYKIDNFLEKLKRKKDIIDFEKIDEKTTIIQTPYSEIVDTQNRIELKTALINEEKNYNKSILKNEVKIMIDLALKKGWKLEEIKASGSKEFIEAVNREISNRLKREKEYNYSANFSFKI